MRSLQRLQTRTRRSFKDLVNTALREGLAHMERPPAATQRFRTPTADLGQPLLPNFDNIGEVLAILEGEDHK